MAGKKGFGSRIGRKARVNSVPSALEEQVGGQGGVLPESRTGTWVSTLVSISKALGWHRAPNAPR